MPESTATNAASYTTRWDTILRGVIIRANLIGIGYNSLGNQNSDDGQYSSAQSIDGSRTPATDKSSMNRPLPRTRVTARGEDRAQQIRSMAAQLFLAKGYERVTLDEIAKVSRGSKSSVYENFASKDGIFIASMHHIIEHIIPLEIPHLAPSLSFTERLFKMCNYLADFYVSKDYLQFYRLALVESERFPPLGAAWLNHGPDVGRRSLVALISEAHPTIDQPGPIHQMGQLLHDAVVFEPLQRSLAGKPLSTTQRKKFVDNTVKTLLPLMDAISVTRPAPLPSEAAVG